MITHVAVWHAGVCYACPRPLRHCDVYQQYLYPLEDAGQPIYPETLEEGFLIDSHIYIDRYYGLQYAQQSGQVTLPLFQPRFLFSEDLW